MGKQPQARKKRQVNRHKPRFMKVKNYRQKNLKDLDEVHDTIKKLDDKPAKPSLEVNEDLPGLGQFHCLECRWVVITGGHPFEARKLVSLVSRFYQFHTRPIHLNEFYDSKLLVLL